MKKIIFALAILPLMLFADFKSISVSELEELSKKGVPIIDIRTPGEWRETGVVPNSKKIMFFDERGNYNLMQWMGEFEKVVKSKDEPFVLVCRTASRTKMVGKFLSEQAGYKNVKELRGGITNWIRHGKPTQK
jgi:rhodanese-related sulfurtransferase